MKILFEVINPLGVKIRITEDYWDYIIKIKHPIMKEKQDLVQEVLSNPDEIRRSIVDGDVFLYYKKIERLYCVVTKNLNGEGFIITTYPSDKIKGGSIIWKR
ncbi:MAG: DUF4258 domain-containing protein [bacterium]